MAHGLNPYVNVLEQVPTDPVFPYSTWPTWTNPYGPLATLSFYPLGAVAVPQALWLSKAAAAAANSVNSRRRESFMESSLRIDDSSDRGIRVACGCGPAPCLDLAPPHP